MNKPTRTTIWSDGLLLMLSTLIVNVGNYAFNLLAGRALSPEAFGEANFLVTSLLAISFVATAFQLTAAKFSDANGQLTDIAWISGIVLALVVFFSAESLTNIFHLSSDLLVLALGGLIPFYFVLSVGRGTLQGGLHMGRFAATYQVEMWVRLLLGIGLVVLTHSVWGVSIGLFMSIIVCFLFTLWAKHQAPSQVLRSSNQPIGLFFGATLAYEFSQIFINNSDVLFVKHYFGAHEAGLYAALALIGRVVYFGTWSVVMVLFPKVIDEKKKGNDTHHLFIKSFSVVALIALLVVLLCLLMPEYIVSMLFGGQYLAIVPYLWQYACVTALFACANVWVYYHLSLDRKLPIVLSVVAGMLQFVLLSIWHTTFGEVIQSQLIAMVFLFVSLLVYHTLTETKSLSFDIRFN